jgi:hypothetical protein
MLGFEFEMDEVDNYPDPSMLEQFPNWIVDETGRSRFVTDACHVRPQRQSQRIQRDTAFSAGDVWFPDAGQCAALIRVSMVGALGIVVYYASVWGLSRYVDTTDLSQPLKLRMPDQRKSCDVPNGPRGFGDRSVFPLRYSTE